MAPFWKKKNPRAVVVFTRADCRLCDEAFAVLERAARRAPLAIEAVDIAGNDDLERLHGERIPVVYIDGRERFWGRVDPVLLRRILDRPAEG